MYDLNSYLTDILDYQGEWAADYDDILAHEAALEACWQCRDFGKEERHADHSFQQ
jgi:hypothetical protein